MPGKGTILAYMDVARLIGKIFKELKGRFIRAADTVKS